MADFLLELGLEEIPARMIAEAEAELGRRVGDLLTRERLLGADGKVTTYSTPRRLAVRVEGLAAAQPDAEERLTGPSWAIAFKNGEPGPAAIAFAKKAGVEVSALEKVTNTKGEYLGATVQRKGRETAELLAAELPKEVLSIYWAKNMYWRANKPERFVRPLRWLVALLDSIVIPLEIAGIAAGNQTRGHRILHGDAPIVIANSATYLEILRSGYVEADVAARRHTIRKALDHVTRAITETPSARWREDEALVETVVHLTEWPTVLYGSFEAEYLALPEEVLVTVMRDHQKYFAVEDASGKLAPHFLTVLNTQVDEEGRAIIRHGNERVLRSRFKDAQFFWNTDQKIPLVDRVEMLKSVTFQKDLGSYHWKTMKNLATVEELAAMVGQKGIAYDWTALETATRLAKADLTAELVKEFTELQGIIGGLYARSQGLGEAVAEAIYWQYSPASVQDQVPPMVEGQLLGLGDRIQTITAMFGIGNAPSGSKDPFALRRAANAIIKILAESELPLTIDEVVYATGGFSGQGMNPPNTVRAFLTERLSFYLKDVLGFKYYEVNAVLAEGSNDVVDAIKRAESVRNVLLTEDFKAISESSKRMKNILRQAEEKQYYVGASKPVTLKPEAVELGEAAHALSSDVAGLRECREYGQALAKLATLRPYIDRFFDAVMVLDPDPDIRGANLQLIEVVKGGFSGIADFSEIVVA